MENSNIFTTVTVIGNPDVINFIDSKTELLEGNSDTLKFIEGFFTIFSNTPEWIGENIGTDYCIMESRQKGGTFVLRSLNDIPVNFLEQLYHMLCEIDNSVVVETVYHEEKVDFLGALVIAHDEIFEADDDNPDIEIPNIDDFESEKEYKEAMEQFHLNLEEVKALLVEECYDMINHPDEVDFDEDDDYMDDDEIDDELFEIEELAFEKGDFKTATERLEKILEQEPNYFDALLLFADIKLEQSDCDKALPVYQKCVDLAPDNAVLHVRLARCYQCKSNWEKASAEIDNAMKCSDYDENIEFVNRVRSEIAYNLGDFATAATAAEISIKEDDGSYFVALNQINLAKALIKLGRFNEAKTAIEIAVEADDAYKGEADELLKAIP